MAIRSMTDKTGQRIAVALEKQGAAADTGKNIIPKLPDGTIAKLCKEAFQIGHYSSTEIQKFYPMNTSLGGWPYLAFLEGMKTLSNYDESDNGRIAYAGEHFLNYLSYELTETRLNQFITVKNGKITGINGCTVQEVFEKHMPSGAAFLILSGKVVKALNELNAAGLINDDAAISEMLAANADGLYYHGAQTWLRPLDVSVEPGDTGKLIITMNTPKDGTYDNAYNGTKNNWILIFTDSTSSYYMPQCAANAAIDITTPASPWYGGIVLSPTSAAVSNNRMRVIDDNKFEITLANLEKAMEGGIYSSAVAEDLKYLKVAETQRNMKALGERVIKFA